MKKILSITWVITLTLFSIFILIINQKEFDFTLNNFFLLLILIITTLLFNIVLYNKDKQYINITIENFNIVLIFLTNPFISFIYSIVYATIKVLRSKNKNKIYFLSVANSNFITSIFIYYFFNHFVNIGDLELTLTILLYGIAGFGLMILLEMLCEIIYIQLQGNFEKVITYRQILIRSYLQKFFISIFTYPLIINVFQVYGYSGILFPLGLMFVISLNIKMVIEKHEELNNMKEMSYRDGLTELNNRRYLDEYLEKINENQVSMAVIMMDIDKFKPINDNYNHHVGDQVLKHLSIILKKCIREEDMLVRYGGEEFTIILQDINPQQAKMVAERIRASIEASYAVVDYEGKVINIKYTTSVGLCYCHKERSFHIRDAVKEADKLLYLSKNSGRNRVTTNI